MSKLLQFIFAAYAPLVARFHLVEQTGSVRPGMPEASPSDSAPCARLPDRRAATNARRTNKPRRSKAA